MVSHPIQYHAPLHRRLAASDVVDPEVLFLSDHGLRPSFDHGFGRSIAYDVPLVDGYPFVILRNRSPAPDVSRPFGLINPALWRRINRDSYDAVLVHGWAHVSCWIAFAAAARSKIPYLVRGETHPDAPAVPPLRRLAKHGSVGPLVRRAGACLAIGERNRRFYLAYGVVPSRIVHAPYSIDNRSFAARGDDGRRRRDEMLRSVGLDPALPTIVFAAKLQHWKRPLDVVEAGDRMTAPANLLFIGDGPLRGELEARRATSPRRSAQIGFVNQQSLGEWYGASDVLVLPSGHEPWGLVVNEAMAAGLAVVVSDAVGSADDLVAEATGRVFPVGDIDALALALDAVVGQPVTLRAMQRAAVERVARYDIEATARGVEEAAVVAVRGAP